MYLNSASDADVAKIARSDLLVTLAGCVAPILPDEGPELDAGSSLTMELHLGFSDGSSPVQVLRDLGKDITSGALAFALLCCWRYWDTWGHTSAATWPEEPDGAVPPEPGRLRHLLAVTRLFALTYPDLLARSPVTGDLAGSLMRLAAVLEQDGDQESARKVLLSALYCADQPSSADRIAGEFARLVRADPGLADSDYAAAIVLRAQAIVETTGEGPGENRLRAFDAYWAGLRHLEGCGEARPAMAAVLDKLARSRNYLAVFQPLARSLASSPFGSEPDHFYVTARWPFDTNEATAALLGLQAISCAVDDARRLLVPEEAADFVHADWNTWSFDWPAYPAAVPIGRAVNQAAEFADNLLLFRHESIHVASMIGTLSLTFVALRLAALDAVLGLHRRLTQLDDSHELDPQHPMPELVAKDVLLLANAERLLEILRKEQVLQSVWSPILEGVAIFGELHADFRDDEATTVVDDVLTQFLAEAEDPDNTLPITELWDRVGARLLEAQEAAGPRRLRAYLTAHAVQYFAGYIAVRAVVSRWRHTLGSLGAAPAFRLLLHAVRFPPDDALPDLGLPLEAFTAEAADLAVRWLHAVEQTSSDNLARLRDGWRTDTRTRSLQWTTGSVEEVDDVEASGNEVFGRALTQALQSMAGEDRAPAGRLPETGDESQVVARMVADTFAARGVKDGYVRPYAGSVSEQAGILPIGAATCAFWLAPQARMLCLTVRVVDRGAGEPGGYQGQTVQLEEESFRELERAVQDNPTERLRVSRLADLTRVGLDSGRGLGRHLLVLTLGQWSYVRHLGSLASVPVEAEVRDAVLRRLHPDEAVVLERQVADAERLAESITTWLGRPGSWGLEGQQVTTAAWAQRVENLAREVQSGRADQVRASVSANLLAGLPGFLGGKHPVSDMAQTLDVSQGDVLDVLWASSGAPASVPWLDDFDDQSVACFTKGPAGWDVAAREPREGS